MCRGAKRFFVAVCQGVKKRVFEKMCTSCFCLFYVAKSKKGNMKKMEKGHFKKKNQKNRVFWGGREEKWSFFVKLSFFRKIGKHYLRSEGIKKSIFVATICFWKMVLFLWPFRVTKHDKNRVFSRHR